MRSSARRRGAHLALSLERLQEVAEQPLLRIGLSATQKPIDEVARFLVGDPQSAIRNPAIRNQSAIRKSAIRNTTAPSSTKAIAAPWISASKCRARRSTP